MTIKLPEIEDCNTAPCLTQDALSRTSRPQARRMPKRKASPKSSPRIKHKIEQEETTPKDCQKSSSSEEESASARAKQAHSVIERRYRDNLNRKIMQLHQTLVAVESTSRLTDSLAHHTFYSKVYRTKFRKSNVMTDAINYVHQSKVERRHLSDEIGRLSARLHTLEGLVKCDDCTLLKQMVQMQLQ
ncbi:uncharacterized protein A1O9_09430 [Exophiala aquamarina CBS 119918]|uniref:BHLH domain-containing protein n=1 Tax=Exophiala aquamarina CBS 119918 TaxID=1182545 RepID=A0A072P2F5_9EURO|nr:uncharacterized protein A1O9_09430 [Exophiala aquamarina CBS 119918]KEF54264.1 hypothetical protein A1O9_09430 [Exophiala aquamarina CBS 119918]